MAKKPTTYVASLTMHLGPATVRGRLKPIKRSADSGEGSGETKYCSPAGQRVEQVYRDAEGNCYYQNQLGRATVDDNGVYHMVDPNALADAKASALPVNILNLTVHYKRDTERWMWPSNHASYIFEPVIIENKKVVEDPTNMEWYTFIHEAISNPEFDIVALANIHNSQGLFKLLHYKGYIAVQRQLYPEDLWQDYEELEVKVDDRTKELAKAVTHKLAAPFETDAYKNDILERVKQVTAEDYDPETNPVAIPAAPKGIDLAAQLEAFLAQ
jgi:hypothetical protein